MQRKKSLTCLIDSLENLSQKLDYRCNLNSGGCVYFAYAVAKNCEKFNISYKVCLYDEMSDIDEVLQGSNGCSHGFIVIRGKAINMGICDAVAKDYLLKMNSKELLKFYKRSHWNKIYNKHVNGYVSLKVNKIFNEISTVY